MLNSKNAFDNVKLGINLKLLLEELQFLSLHIYFIFHPKVNILELCKFAYKHSSVIKIKQNPHHLKQCQQKLKMNLWQGCDVRLH